MADGSDAVADWPLLNALINTACGASWVSIHHGGGVGMGKSIHAGQVCVADGTELAGRRIERVLKADPGMGIVRHVDAGYDLAVSAARDHGLRIPMLESSSDAPAGDDLVRQRRPGAHATRAGPALPALQPRDELALEPGGITVEHGRIAALEPIDRREHPRRRQRVRAAPRPRRLPHPPAVRRLARRRVRAEGHGRPVRGDRARRRWDQVLRASPARDARRDRARPGPGARRRDAPLGDDHVRVQVRLRALDRRRAPRAAARDRARADRLAEHDPDRRCSPTPSPTATRPPPGWTRSSRCSRRRSST